MRREKRGREGEGGGRGEGWGGKWRRMGRRIILQMLRVRMHRYEEYMEERNANLVIKGEMDRRKPKPTKETYVRHARCTLTSCLFAHLHFATAAHDFYVWFLRRYRPHNSLAESPYNLSLSTGIKLREKKQFPLALNSGTDAAPRGFLLLIRRRRTEATSKGGGAVAVSLQKCSSFATTRLKALTAISLQQPWP